MLLVTGDMNAKVGDDNRNYERIMGQHELGVRNDNGGRLCGLCDVNELVMQEHRSLTRTYIRRRGYLQME